MDSAGRNPNQARRRNRVFSSGVPSSASFSFTAFRVTRMPLQLSRIPLTVFEVKGMPGNRHERVEVAVVAGAKHLPEPYEGWIVADPFRSGEKLLITRANGFQREVAFAVDEPAAITERVPGHP